MGKRGFFDKIFNRSEKTIVDGTKDVEDALYKTGKTISKQVDKTTDKLFGDALKEFEEVGKDFGHMSDRFLNNLLREEWYIKGIYAKDIMDKANKIKEHDSVKKVINKLKTGEDSLIVIRGKNKIVGLIDEFTLLKLAVSQDDISSQDVVGFMGAGYDRGFTAKHASDLMKTDIYFVTPSTPIEKVSYLLYKMRLRAVPVVKGNKIVGVVHVRNIVGSLK